jgi:hypothetical protein
MNGPGVAFSLSLVVLTSYCGLSTLSQTGPIPTGALVVAPAAPLTVSAPAASGPTSRVISGAVGPLLEGTPPCFAGRYPCEVFDLSLARQGPIEVALTWLGAPRAMVVQLYWAGEGLAHEDVAPREGPPRIWFHRPLMEAAAYKVRVVSLEPASRIPFTLTLTH